MSQQEPNEEELRAALEEQMKRIRVEDVLLQTIVTLINLAARRLGLVEAEDETTDPEQARLGIEGARALIGLVPEEQAGQLREPLSQLQMAYVQMTSASGEKAEGERPKADGEAEGQKAAEDAERAKARAKIWTPGS